MKNTKKVYLLIDQWLEPLGYDEMFFTFDTKEKAIAKMNERRDDETYYGPTDETAIEKIYSLLKAGYRNLAYYVQESDTPFEELPDFY